MGNPRVFELANEAGVDAKAVLTVLSSIGSSVSDAMARVNDGEAEYVRRALVDLRQRSAPTPASVPAPGRREPRPPRPKKSTPKVKIIENKVKGLHSPLQAAYRDATRSESIGLIPALFDGLIEVRSSAPADGVVVAFFDGTKRPQYGLSDLNGVAWTPPPGHGISTGQLLAPMRAMNRRYVEKQWTAPNVFIALDLTGGEAWIGRSLKQLRKNDGREHHLDARTLVKLRAVSSGEPPRLAPKAQVFRPEHVPALSQALGDGADRPEESFLLTEDLLRLAVDSLRSNEQVDPLPVHLNGLWVFSRPVIMQRPDGTDRHIRAVWFRQGQAAWRIRTFTAGIRNDPKEAGERLGGPLPFVPVWRDERPEQKLLAVVWALMAQGDVTESTAGPQTRIASVGDAPDRDLVIVRVKAGTDHATVYRSEGGISLGDRPAWSVRGHWRRQPYPSLGVDENGEVVTKMIWIASYTKGDISAEHPDEKVIIVRP